MFTVIVIVNLTTTNSHCPVTTVAPSCVDRLHTSAAIRQRLIYVVAWLSGNALISINVVTLRRSRLVLGWVTVCGRYVANHLGRLRLLPSVAP